MLLGLHHVTALAGDPQRNLDFYAGFLGLRLVKRTVNFDDPGTYHFYFGDRTGTPGTLLTFFNWPGAFRGRRGSGQAVAVSFAVPSNCLGKWIERARGAGVSWTGPETRFGEKLITVEDGDGVAIELVASAPESDDAAIVRLHSVTLCESDAEDATALLQEILGFRCVSEEGTRSRFDLAGSHLDILRMPGAERGKMSASSSLGTSSGIAAAHAGPFIAEPSPRANVTISSVHGPVLPISVSAPSAAAAKSIQDCVNSSIRRRSTRSAMAPAGNPTRNTGSVVAVCTSATINGLDTRVVISHDAPIVCIHVPMLEAMAAIQIARNKP